MNLTIFYKLFSLYLFTIIGVMRLVTTTTVSSFAVAFRTYSISTGFIAPITVGVLTEAPAADIFESEATPLFFNTFVSSESWYRLTK